MKGLIAQLEESRVGLQREIDAIDQAIEILSKLPRPGNPVIDIAAKKTPAKGRAKRIDARRDNWRPRAEAALLARFQGRQFTPREAHPVISEGAGGPMARTTASSLLTALVADGKLERIRGGVYRVTGEPTEPAPDGWKMPRSPKCTKCLNRDTEAVAVWDTGAREWSYRWQCLGCHATMDDPAIRAPYGAYLPSAAQLRRLGFGVIQP